MSLSMEKPRVPDETLMQDLAALSSSAQLRLGAFRLFARLLADAPTARFLGELRDTGLVATLAELAEKSLSAARVPLRQLAEWLDDASDADFEAARQDHLALFVAAKHLPAPPWESVYTSPDRLVNQEAARDALAAYAEAGVVFDEWKSTPADHVSLELSFMATLLAEGARDAQARARLERFEVAHPARWLPRFCADLGRAAKSPVYLRLGEALPALLQVPPGA